MSAEAIVETGFQLRVDLGQRSYPIYVGYGLLDGMLKGVERLRQHIDAKQIFIVSNETVAPLYLERLKDGLPGDCQIDDYLLPDGERYKTLESFSAVMDSLISKRHNRSTTIIALGGGVVGDIAGFVAASYQRGVNYIQVPTTLLAQVDSAVGGKTAVNHAAGKNLIGSFYQPRCVIADIALLDTLPEREYLSGLAEVIKYGPIADAEFFYWLESNLDALRAREPMALSHAVLQSCKLKADIVAQDEREGGMRAILNFGHTFAHALEKLTGYQSFLHGEAVAIGMLLATELSKQSQGLPIAEAERINSLLGRSGLPLKLPTGLALADFLSAMGMDKKVLDGRLRLILLRRLGCAEVTDQISEQVLEHLLLQAGCSDRG